MTRTQLVSNFVKKIGIAAAILIILTAVFSSIFRSLTPWAKQYKGEVEHRLSTLIGQPVTIQNLETGWYWFQPVLKMEQITIKDGNRSALHLDKLFVGINLFKSLWQWKIQTGVLYLDDIHLVLREKDERWYIDGLSTQTMHDADMSPESTQHLLVWLANQERLIIRRVSAQLYFSNGGLIPVSGLNISILNSGGHYQIKGDARLDQSSASTFQLAGDLYFNPNHREQTKGRLFLSAKKLLPAQWQTLFPKTSQQLKGGKGSILLWLDLDEGAVAKAQAQIRFKRLAWHLPQSKNKQYVQLLESNLSWTRTQPGWQLEADHINLRVGGVQWPENKLRVAFDKAQQSYQVYVQSIILESVFAQVIEWPKSIKTLVGMKPSGVLKDAQFLVKEKQVQGVLARFDDLGWAAFQDIPKVRKLSGVINWQPQEGHLELDSENTTISIKGHPAEHFEILNGSLEWKELNDGLRFSLDRFVLSQKQLTISAQGSVDKVSSQSIGNMQLDADFSGKNLQKWTAFLPKKYLKPKLYQWLREDVKRIGEATGKITLKGLGKDFPFDSAPGEFSIVSHTSGVELLITSKWQLIKSLEGYLTFKNRNFNADLVYGDFHGVPVHQMNLRIDDIGKDKETLLIHTAIHAKAQKMIDFVLASPLKTKLSALSMFTIKGLLNLDLHLEIPLYPENDENLAKGTIAFEKNNVLFMHQVGHIQLDEVAGNLAFTEKGIHDSALTATTFGYPLTISMQSVDKPKPATVVLVQGKSSVDSLKAQLNSPFFNYVKGLFQVNAKMRFTHDPDDFDSMVLHSTLEGLSIDLPEPLGKSADAKVPLDVKLNFNPKMGFRIRANYDGRISSDVLFEDNKGALDLKSGQILLGSPHATQQSLPGLAVVGKLDGFPLQAWTQVLKQWSTDKSQSNLAHYLRIIDVQFGKLTFLKQDFDKMSVKAKMLPDNAWSFSLLQTNIAGDLTYHPPTNALSGYIHRLHLAEIKSEPGDSKTSDLHPGQIPNLNLRIDNLTVGAMQIGNLTVKTKSTPKRLAIDYCRIESPVYQFDIQGAWTQNNALNQTKMQVKLHVKDLAKSLERWDITPAVDAGKGDLEFSGEWNKSLFDFSIAALSGSMQLKLKNGIITHLSPETEEKLGLGKLLSILSLQTIPRRLQLDFSDLSHQGYSFDIFSGNFSIKKGIMSTQDSYLDGPVAYAGMKGDLDLVRRLYDLNLTISPHITASLPIVATIAGGPVAGLAAWIANKIINQGMQKIIAYSYKISGPWKEPVVQQLSLIRQIEKKK